MPVCVPTQVIAALVRRCRELQAALLEAAGQLEVGGTMQLLGTLSIAHTGQGEARCKR